MWQLIILIGVILCIYIITRIPKKSKYSLGSDNYEMIKCDKCGVMSLRMRLIKIMAPVSVRERIKIYNEL